MIDSSPTPDPPASHEASAGARRGSRAATTATPARTAPASASAGTGSGGVVSWAKVSVLLAISAVVGVATFAVTSQSLPNPGEPQPIVAPAPPEEPAVDPRVAREAFYDEHVEPKIFETDVLNRQAADRALVRTQQTFDRYRAGVDGFVKDLTSLSTRMGIVRRMPGQWWAGDERINAYVRDKFEKHLFSEKQLLADIGGNLTTFQQEVDANQRKMLTEIQAALSLSDLPDVEIAPYEAFYETIAEKLQQYSSDQGTATVYNALTVLLVSETGSYVATGVVSGLLVRFGTTAAVSTVAASGATAGTATVGAGGGSLGGPVGTVVGFGVGLAVGLVVDWWMTEKFEAEMSSQMNTYLDSLEHSVLFGSPKPASDKRASATGVAERGSVAAGSRDGLAGAMPVVCDRLLDAYRERFYEQVVLGD